MRKTQGASDDHLFPEDLPARLRDLSAHRRGGCEAILTAAKVGYRAFDTAQMYGNEAETGEALAATGVPREELCITTKVHPDNYTDDRFLPSVEQSLRDLRVGQVDVLLLHWPPVGGDVAPSLRLLEKSAEARAHPNIGVSNYNIAMMREAVRIVDAPLVTNQVEYHPLLNQDRLMAGANEVGIPLSSYSSVARGEVFRHPEFAEIGDGLRQERGAGRAALDPPEGREPQHHVDEARQHPRELRHHGLHAELGRHGADRPADAHRATAS
jgi:diketogulonate reductase-like aldo/keto reductase